MPLATVILNPISSLAHTLPLFSPPPKDQPSVSLMSTSLGKGPEDQELSLKNGGNGENGGAANNSNDDSENAARMTEDQGKSAALGVFMSEEGGISEKQDGSDGTAEKIPTVAEEEEEEWEDVDEDGGEGQMVEDGASDSGISMLEEACEVLADEDYSESGTLLTLLLLHLESSSCFSWMPLFHFLHLHSVFRTFLPGAML